MLATESSEAARFYWRPPNEKGYLKLSARPIRLVAADIPVAPIKIDPPEEAEIGDLFEAHKAAWTAWILGTVAKGYSVEQITMYMLEEKKPAFMIFPDAGPVITGKVVDPATGKWELDASGNPVMVIVRPEFPPKGSAFNPGEIDGAEKFTSDLAKDFEDLLDGKTPVRPADGEAAPAAKPKPGKSGAKVFNLKLGLPSYSEKTLVSSKLTMTITKGGKVSGSYSAEVVYSNGDWRTVENGTFAGEVEDFDEPGKLFIDLDGTRKGQTFVKGKLFRFDNTSDKLVTGTLSPDYASGKGSLYGSGELYTWRIGR